MKNPDVAVREVSLEDSSDLWRIRNHPDVRRLSNRPDPIPRDQHDQWFEKYRAHPDNHAYVLVVGGVVAGYCRIDSGLVSIAIDPVFQGRGFSKMFLTTSILQARRYFPLMTAEVRLDNPVSLRLFQSVGFRVVSQDNEKHVLQY